MGCVKKNKNLTDFEHYFEHSYAYKKSFPLRRKGNDWMFVF